MPKTYNKPSLERVASLTRVTAFGASYCDGRWVSEEIGEPPVCIPDTGTKD